MNKLESLRQISKEYEKLKIEASSQMNSYFERSAEEDFTREIENGEIPRWKELEKVCDNKVMEFVSMALKISKEERVSENTLIKRVAQTILENDSTRINHFLLINLMWEIGKEEGTFSLDILESLMRKLLEENPLQLPEDYYLESYLDIWNYDSKKPIPAGILEKIILLKPNGDNSYGAFIKAVSYLSGHPDKVVMEVLNKARATIRYKEDEYYRDWID